MDGSLDFVCVSVRMLLILSLFSLSPALALPVSVNTSQNRNEPGPRAAFSGTRSTVPERHGGVPSLPVEKRVRYIDFSSPFIP